MKWAVLLGLLLALPARATPELQFSAGLPHTWFRGDVRTDVALRLGAGWHFGRHVLGVGVSDRGSAGFEPWGYYRSPAWEAAPHVGLVGLGEWRFTEWVWCTGPCSHATGVMTSLGGGALVSAGTLTVLASLTVGATLPWRSPAPAEAAFLVNFIFGPPELPAAEKANVRVRLGGGAYALRTPFRDGPAWTPEFVLDAGASIGWSAAGGRFVDLSRLDPVGKAGEALLGWYEHDLGAFGERLSARVLVAAGPALLPAQCGGPGVRCNAKFGGAAQLEVGVVVGLGAADLTLGASGFAAVTEVPDGHGPIVGTGLVARAAWNGGR